MLFLGPGEIGCPHQVVEIEGEKGVKVGEGVRRTQKIRLATPTMLRRSQMATSFCFSSQIATSYQKLITNSDELTELVTNGAATPKASQRADI